MTAQSVRIVIAGLIVGASVQGSFAQSNSGANSAPSSAVPADNSKSNKMDSSNATATADAQKENSTDRTLTQRIRKSVIADKSLSMYAHNVKIVSMNGTVTLNGVVRSEDEKSSVEKKATTIAGPDKVVNDLKVAPSK